MRAGQQSLNRVAIDSVEPPCAICQRHAAPGVGDFTAGDCSAADLGHDDRRRLGEIVDQLAQRGQESGDPVRLAWRDVIGTPPDSAEAKKHAEQKESKSHGILGMAIRAYFAHTPGHCRLAEDALAAPAPHPREPGDANRENAESARFWNKRAHYVERIGVGHCVVR